MIYDKRSTRLKLAAGALALGFAVLVSGAQAQDEKPWLSRAIISEQAAASGDAARELVANRRAKLLLSAMTLDQKLQQLTGAKPEVLPELPQCYGARHVSAAFGTPPSAVWQATQLPSAASCRPLASTCGL